MKKALIFILILSMTVPLFGQTIEEILKMVDEVTTLNYAREISSDFGITGVGISTFANVSSQGFLSGSATATLEVSKSLRVETGISSKNVEIMLNFDPFSYDRSVKSVAEEEMNATMRMRQEAIETFFDAMRIYRQLEELSNKATSLSIKARVTVLKAYYSYDLGVLSDLLGEKVKSLEFPNLVIPHIPRQFTPYIQRRKEDGDFDFDFKVGADFSENLTFKIGVEYSWSPKAKKAYVPNALNDEKEEYYVKMKALAQVVSMYDKRIANLFDEYSKLYSEYLNGRIDEKVVNVVSNEIYKIGYTRDMYCIQLLEMWYLYTYFGE